MARSRSTQPEKRRRRAQNSCPQEKAPKNETKPSKWPLWLGAHLFILALAIFSWAWCIQLFSSPEKAGHYGFLRQMNLLPALRAFSPLEVPAGEVCPPPRLHQRHANLSPSQLDALSRQWLRDFLRNYHKAEKRLYLTGDYEIRQVRPLSDTDPISPGLVISLRAQLIPEGGNIPSDYPVAIEWLLPSQDASANDYPVGSRIELSKVPDCLTPLHVSVLPGGQFPLVKVSAISLGYGPRDTPAGTQVTTAPPESLKLRQLRLREAWPDQRDR